MPDQPKPPPKLYKVLDAKGRSPHRNFPYPLPVGGKPGEWVEIVGALRPHANGFYLTTDPATHHREGYLVYEAQLEGEFSADGNAVCARKVRLLRKVAWRQFGIAPDQTRFSRALSLLKKIHRSTKAPSDREHGYAMAAALKLAIQLRLPFGPYDISVFADKLGGRHAFGTTDYTVENVFAFAVECRHETACRAFEFYQSRPPFLYDGKRLTVGAHVRWQGRHFRVSSFKPQTATRDATVTLCAHQTSFVMSDNGWPSTIEKLVKRLSLTAADLLAVEQERQRRVRVEGQAKRLAEGVPEVSYEDGRQYALVAAGWSEPELKAAMKWAKTWERSGDLNHEQRAACIAAAPDCHKQAVALIRKTRLEHKAEEALRAGIHKANGGRGWEWDYVITDEMIAQVVGGKSADEVLSIGDFGYIECPKCRGNGGKTCKRCKSGRFSCPLCDGHGRTLKSTAAVYLREKAAKQALAAPPPSASP